MSKVQKLFINGVRFDIVLCEEDKTITKIFSGVACTPEKISEDFFYALVGEIFLSKASGCIIPGDIAFKRAWSAHVANVITMW